MRTKVNLSLLGVRKFEWKKATILQRDGVGIQQLKESVYISCTALVGSSVPSGSSSLRIRGISWSASNFLGLRVSFILIDSRPL